MSGFARSPARRATRRTRRLGVPACLLVLAIAWLAFPGVASAATFTVNSTTDAVDSNLGNGVCLTAGGVCTLRAAIQEANALAGADIVNVAPGTYTLTLAGQGENSAATGDLDITGSLTLAGTGSAATIIDGGAIDRVIEVRSSGVTITRVMIRNGSVGDDGGGIRLHGANGLTLTEAAVVDSDIGGKKGGGISASSGALVLTNVTISGNRAKDAPAIFNQSAPITLTNVTMANNTGTGRGAFDPGSGTVVVRNTIIALNVGVADCDSAVGPGVNNLDGDGSCGFATTANPLIGPLGDNGGPSSTHALQTGSPAIDAGTNVGAPATDQRGVARPQGPTVDIGAYEASASVPAIVKRVFLLDGTPLADGVTVPRGTRIIFLLYVNRPGGAIADVSLADALDPGFAYIASSIRTNNTVAACVAAACTPAEEAAIFAAANAAPAGSDAVDTDTVSFTGGVVRAGNQSVANAQLDIAGAKVYALVFTVRVQ